MDFEDHPLVTCNYEFLCHQSCYKIESNELKNKHTLKLTTFTYAITSFCVRKFLEH